MKSDKRGGNISAAAGDGGTALTCRGSASRADSKAEVRATRNPIRARAAARAYTLLTRKTLTGGNKEKEKTNNNKKRNK